MLGINQWEMLVLLAIGAVVIGFPVLLFLIIRAAIRSANRDKR